MPVGKIEDQKVYVITVSSEFRQALSIRIWVEAVFIACLHIGKLILFELIAFRYWLRFMSMIYP